MASSLNYQLSMRSLTLGFVIAFIACALAGSMFSACGDSEKLKEKERELEELRQLAELDKREMENQYAEFALQYAELKKSIKNDSLAALLDKEQKRAEELLRELKNVKSTSSAEILRLKKELETVRAVLRDYIRQVDSLQRLNVALAVERDEALAEAARTRQQNTEISNQRAALQEKVEIAAQLNATDVVIVPLKKTGKFAKRCKDIKTFSVDFSIERNVTAATGVRTVFVRLLKPSGAVVNPSERFKYENKTLECSASKVVEYDGTNQRIKVYVPVVEYLEPGTYTAYIFIDGQHIGTGGIEIES
jgi:myosin heavy subunit